MGTVTIDAIDLDPGQEYTLDWVVEDYSLSAPTIMMQNDHIWVVETMERTPMNSNSMI